MAEAGVRAASPYPLMRVRRRRGGNVLRRVIALVTPRTIAIAVLLAVVAGAGFVMTRARPVDPRAAYAAAIKTLRQGNYSAARSNALAAAAGAPGNGAAQLVLARAYLQLGEGLAAEAALQRAADDGVAARNLHHLRAQALLLQGDPDAALAELDTAPASFVVEATRIRARALAAQGKGMAAQELLGGLLADRPGDGPAWTDLGRIRLTVGEVGGAADAASRAVAASPDDPAALTLQGEVVRSRFGLTAALPWFEAALKRDAYYHPALIEYAATLGEAGRNADMLAAARRANAARPGSPQAAYLMAVLAARAGKFDLARAMLGRAGAISGLPGALLLGGTLDYAAGQVEGAVAKWRELVAGQPMNVSARRLLGAALLRSGDAQGALDILRPIGMRGDADGYSLELIARAFAATGDAVAAARYHDRADAAGRGPASAFAGVDSIGALAAGASQSPTDPTYAVGLIRGLVASGDTASAIGRARALTVASTGAPATWLALGDSLTAAGRQGEAADAYARAADLSFDEPTMLRLVDALGRAGRARQAAEALALYLSQNPQNPVALRLAGHWQVVAGDWRHAIETLESVRRLTGNRDAALLTDLALAYAGDGDGAVARRYGRAAYALAPMNVATVTAYATALEAAGDVGAARQLRDKAAALQRG